MRMSARRPITALRRGGDEFPAEASISKLDVGGQLVFTVILRDITERVEAARQLRQANDQLELRVRERTAELAAANESLRELSGRLLRLQDEERRRIARELHDSTAQNLFLLIAQLTRMRNVNAGSQPDSDNLLAQCLRLAEQTTSEIRTLSYLLHPPLLEEFGLAAALRWYADGFSRRSGISVDLDVDPELGRLPAEVELTVFRIVQESLANVHRHSQSPTARITVRREDGQLKLSVADQGRGIPHHILEFNRPTPLGVGIAGMRERVRQLGGCLDLRSDSEGTTVTAILPLFETDYKSKATA